MSAALLSPDGTINIGVPMATQPGQSTNPSDPHVIASQFAAFAAGHDPTPAQGPPAAQVPAQTPAPAAVEEPGQPAREEPVTADDGVVRTTEDLAKVFEVESVDEIFGVVTHRIGDKDYTITEIIEGFSAQPDALQVVAQRDGLENEFEQRGLLQRSAHETAMETLSSIQAELSAQITSDESPERLGQLSIQDPAAYQAKLVEIQSRKLAADKAEIELTRQADKTERDAKAANDLRLQSEARKLSVAFPEWEDPTQGPLLKAKMSTYAHGLGFTDQEMASITDHRFMLLMRDAAVGSAIRTNGVRALKNAKDAKLPAPAAKPGARAEILSAEQRSNQGRAASYAKFTKSGNVKDLGVLFSQMLETK